MSIRNSPPPYDTNVPVVTSAGGTSAAYKDPNSPESLMKKTTMMQAQAAVDSTYDVKEGFSSMQRESLLFLLLFLIGIVLIQNRIQKSYRWIVWFSFALGLFLLLRVFH